MKKEINIGDKVWFECKTESAVIQSIVESVILTKDLGCYFKIVGQSSRYHADDIHFSSVEAWNNYKDIWTKTEERHYKMLEESQSNSK